MSQFKTVLAIETSCDDTSVALVGFDGQVHGQVTANQDSRHRLFGGVVPEIASRAHTEVILGLIEELFETAQMNWDQVDGIVTTSRPGLVGALMVGVVTAKTLSLVKRKPWIGVNHLEGHLLAPFLKDDHYQPPENFDAPFVALAVSGGHSHIYLVKEPFQYGILGKTVDDAAGEAFDKLAKLLGLGFPGGVLVDKMATQGDPEAHSFPRSFIKEDHYNFSFSGLKSSAVRLWEALPTDQKEKEVANICASYQRAIVDVLLAKLFKASEEFQIDRLVITGGVSANSELRSTAEDLCKEKGLRLAIPPLRYCTDNAAMIGLAGIQRLSRGEFSTQEEGPSPRNREDDFYVPSL